MNDIDLFCFSQEELDWNPIVKDGRRVFEVNGYKLKDWDNCNISAFPTDGGKVRVNVRRKNIQYSMYMKKNIEIKFLYSFDISSVREPVVEKYDQSGNCCRNDTDQQFRWAIHLEKEGDEHQDRKECSIWQWASKQEITQSKIFRLFTDLEMKLNKPSDSIINLDDVDKEADDDKLMMPVIVQPSTDGWKNYVRQVHCTELNDSEDEVTLVFNDEHLRKHSFLESFYRFLRPYLYGRLTDLESFRVIRDRNTASYCVFPGIYSGMSNIMEDSIHGDKEGFLQKAPRRRVKYHYSNKMHPIIFINTANHAIAELDNNQTLWKWEFVAWKPDSPIVYGNKSRKDIEELVKNLDEKETVDKVVYHLRQQQNIPEKSLIGEKERKQYVDHIRREYIVNKTTAERILSKAISKLSS
jgi:hypothetical protein